VSEEEFRVALAVHLRDTGAVMYGSSWCPACSRQKELFADAFSYVDYVECAPYGDDARPELCETAGIVYVPTWEIKGQLHVGSRPLEELAELSGYEGPRPGGSSAGS